MSKRITLYGRHSGHWVDGEYVDPIDERLRDRLDFHIGTRSFRGEAGDPGPGLAGWLPEDWREQWRRTRYQIDYVVWSYQTPIAWHLGADDTWVVPNVKYSPTTTTHQTTLERALVRLGERVRDPED